MIIRKILLGIVLISAQHALSQLSTDQFFTKVDTFMFRYVTNGKVNYKSIKANMGELNEITNFIESQSIDGMDKNTKKAYLINVYNLCVIKQIVTKYPIKSPMDVTGFFETTKFNIGGKKWTLNYLENSILRKEYKDPRFHFVLVCGALGCPVITNFAYFPNDLDSKLEAQTKKALNNSKFVYQNDKGVFLSEIFKWYSEDFGGTAATSVAYINKYRNKAFSKTAKVQYYTYDWKLNEFVGPRNEYLTKTDTKMVTEIQDEKSDSLPEIPNDSVDSIELAIDNLQGETVIGEIQHDSIMIVKNMPYTDTIIEILENPEDVPLDALSIGENDINLQTYTAGTLLNKGQFDFTLFNSIYTETKGNWLGSDFTKNRTSLFTSSLQMLHGISKNRRINIGLELNFKTTADSDAKSFNRIGDVFTFQNSSTRRSGLANVGLRAKVSPFEGVNDFSIQTTFYVPTIKHPEGFVNPDGSGQGNLAWSDWNRYVSWTQFFYVKSFRKFQFFSEADLLFRFGRTNNQMDHLDIPVTFICSYFPTSKLTFYGIGQHANRFLYNINPTLVNDWVQPMNYSTLGAGFKYQPVSNITLELLYTNFVRGKNSGLGSTFNLGIKMLTK